MKKTKKMVLVTMVIMAMVISTLTACGGKATPTTPASTVAMDETPEPAEYIPEESSKDETPEPAEYVPDETPEPAEVKYDASSAKGDFAQMNGEFNQFIHLDDKTMSDCVVLFSVDGTSNYTNAFYWEGPSEIGASAKVYDEDIALFNKENTSIIVYNWNATPSETIIGESDDSDYDLMISNGQFTFYFPSDYDQEKAQEVFDSFKVLTVDEANALVGDMKEAIKFSN